MEAGIEPAPSRSRAGRSTADLLHGSRQRRADRSQRRGHCRRSSAARSINSAEPPHPRRPQHNPRGRQLHPSRPRRTTQLPRWSGMAMGLAKWASSWQHRTPRMVLSSHKRRCCVARYSRTTNRRPRRRSGEGSRSRREAVVVATEWVWRGLTQHPEWRHPPTRRRTPAPRAPLLQGADRSRQVLSSRSQRRGALA